MVALNTDLSRLYSTMAREFALTNARLKFIKCRPSSVFTRDNVTYIGFDHY